MRRREFQQGVKRDAVSLLETSGKSMSQVARELGLRSSVLGAWRDMVQAERKSGSGTDEQEELKRLRREYIAGFYNPTRRHSTLKYMSPMEYQIAVQQ